MKTGNDILIQVFKSPDEEPNRAPEAIEFAPTEKVIAAKFVTDIYDPFTIQLMVFDFFLAEAEPSWQK